MRSFVWAFLITFWLFLGYFHPFSLMVFFIPWCIYLVWGTYSTLSVKLLVVLFCIQIIIYSIVWSCIKNKIFPLDYAPLLLNYIFIIYIFVLSFVKKNINKYRRKEIEKEFALKQILYIVFASVITVIISGSIIALNYN